jgi:hypothetical protein
MKSLLNLDKIMNKKQANMEKMVALVALAYIIGFLVGEQIRDHMYSGSRKWEQFSGLFILIRRKIRLAKEALSQALEAAYILFRAIVLANVRSHV